MNLKELQKIDLKNFDSKKVTEILLANKDFAMQVGLVVGTLFIIFSLVGQNGIRNKSYRDEISKLNAKEGTIKTYEASLKELKKFKAGVPKELEEDEFSSLVTDLASKDNVNILSFSPGQRRKEDLAEVVTMHMTVRVSTYKDFAMFIKDLESSPSSLRIDQCMMGAIRSAGDGPDVIEAQLDLSSVSIKK